MNTKQYVIGVDYGTDSVRSVIVDTANGAEIASDVFYYPRWKKGLYCEPAKNQFRQHPLDYLEGLTESIKSAWEKPLPIRQAGLQDCQWIPPVPPLVRSMVQGIPGPYQGIREQSQCRCLVLWKDHTAVKEAEEINMLAHSEAWKTLPGLWGEFTLRSGSGPRFCMSCVRMRRYY